MASDTTSASTVLVVEDDRAIREGLVDALGFDGHRVLQAADAPSGTEAALRSACDLVLLDLMLPGGDGLSVLKEIRRLKPQLPVIILTARGREADRVKGLRLGADDYVVKPFSIRELLARVEAVLRRATVPSEAPDHTALVIAGGSIDLARREVVWDDGVREELSEREVAVVAHLSRNRERAVSRDELLRDVWGVDPARSKQSRTVDMLVARLRDKLRDSADGQVIVTVRGRGYKLGDPT